MKRFEFKQSLHKEMILYDPENIDDSLNVKEYGNCIHFNAIVDNTGANFKIPKKAMLIFLNVRKLPPIFKCKSNK